MQVKGCPYYASRNAVDDAQIIVLPYNTLLHKPTREAVGIKLKGSVVIVDEAHNLMDTISHIHGMEVSGKHLCHAHSQLSQYLERYKSRLKAKNLLYIRQIIFILANLIKYVGGKAGKDPEQSVPESSKMILPHVLMVDSEIFNLNIFKIIRYVERSKIAQKLLGFNEKYNGQVASTTANKAKENNSKGVNAFLQSIKNKKSKEASEENEVSENVKKPSSTVNSPLLMIVEFLQALTNTKSEARILVSTQGGSLARSSLKYILMNPASQFTDLVRDCRSIIVAGGTMQPISEFKQQLFLGAGASEERISHFSCGHVTPKENILPLVLQAGPTGRTLDFTFENRNKPEIMNELFLVLLNMSNIIPGGIVCFFPSYDYEARLFDFWEKSGMTAKLNAKKKLFREPKRSDEMDKVLKDYSRSANGKSGAILLSVVGGKMSEGINFSDDLGRCVVMVGLPFPNSKSPELKEKMSYLNKTVSADEGGAGRLPGQVHYENLCMKAVNQSIGRAIRHKADYASILLLDHRYKRPNIRGQLPGWIQEHVQVMEKFGLSVPAVRKFFKAKET